MNRVFRIAVLMAACQLIAVVAHGAAAVHPPFVKVGDSRRRHSLRHT